MIELMNQLSDASFVSALLDLVPAVAVGLILGIIAAVIGWVWGFVIRISRLEL